MTDMTNWKMNEHGVIDSVITVLYFDKKINNKNYWICRCGCQQQTIFSAREDSLKCGKIKSCGHCGNQYKFIDDYMILIDCNNNEIMIDIADYEKIKNIKWRVDKKSGYVSARINKKSVKLHRFLMEPKENEQVDHINHNKTDNRRQNLRICTSAQNNYNKKTRGIRFDKRRGLWQAYIYVSKKFKHLRYYEDELEALNARIEAEKIYHKEFRYYESKN